MRNDQFIQIPSLAFYVFQFMKKQTTPDITECIPQYSEDYKSVLAKIESEARAISDAAELNILPLDDIDIEFEDFKQDFPDLQSKLQKAAGQR